MSLTTGACVDKKADNQKPAPKPTPTTQTQLDVSGIDKDKAFFVTPTGTKDKDCTTWENACDLQTAINNANADATKKFVLVAKGTYFADPAKTDIAISFNLKSGVKIYGGFDISAEELKRSAQPSILEGKLSDTLKTKQILKGENLTDATILDGFVIQNAAGANNGGGLFLNKSNPKLTNLVFKNNNSSTYGGAIFNNNSSPSISNSVFTNNSTERNGGAIYNDNNSSPSVSNSTFIGNSANGGGAIYNLNNSSPNISNSTFNSNSAKQIGGAIFNNISSSPSIRNSAFNNNSAKQSGGAIYNWQNSTSVSNSTFIGNSAKYCGAIVNRNSSPSISNSIFINNSAIDIGGAIYNWQNSSPNISNSILWNNKDKQTGGKSINNIYNEDTESKPTIKNSILNANSAVTMQSGKDDSSKTDPYNFMDFSKAEFKDNQNPANFVIESDGKITDTASQELIKDKGDNALYLNVYDLIHGTSGTSEIPTDDKDLANNPRLNGASIDIGAYELQD